MSRRLLPLLLLALTATTLHAQAKLAIYGTFGGEKTGVANESWTKAGTLGLYYGLAKLGPLALSADARADLSTNADSGLFGPRLALHLPAFPLKPYAELLLGFSHYSNVSGAPRNTTGFAYRGVAGLDATILPHIDWRVIDFSDGHIENADNNSISLTTGIVLRF
jgi:hypothetical protein